MGRLHAGEKCMGRQAKPPRESPHPLALMLGLVRLDHASILQAQATTDQNAPGLLIESENLPICVQAGRGRGSRH